MASAVVCAFSPVGTAALEGLLSTGIEVKRLYTYAASPEEAWFSPPAELANRHGIPVCCEPDFNADHVYATIQADAPDFLFSFYFREMIQARFLALPRLGAFNLHGSLLPAYRGRAPLNWVLVHGETQTGLTLHAMTPKPDDGDIVAQRELPIAWDETALSLTWKAARASSGLMRQVIPGLLDGTAPRISQQSLGKSTYFGGRKPMDSRLDPNMTSQEAFNQIRAVADPWPNAFLDTPNGPLKVAWALPTERICPPGHFMETNEGTLFGFRDAALRIVALRNQGMRSERPSDHAAWLRHAGFPEVMAGFR